MVAPVRYVSYLPLVLAKINSTTEHRLEMAVSIYHKQWLELMASEKSGRVYNRGGKAHQASAPGEPPAVDTGLLRASFFPQPGQIVIGKSATEMWVDIGVGANVLYATYLEYGTRFMAPRPLWRPAFEMTKGRINALFII